MLILECVRNKDRMVVELIVRLTRPELVKILNNVSLVVHLSLCWRSTDFRSLINKVFCVSVLALDYEFNSPCPRLLTQGPRSNFEIGGVGGGTISDSIFLILGGGGAQDTAPAPLLLRGPCYNKVSPTSRCNRAEQRYERFQRLMFQQRCGFYDRARRKCVAFKTRNIWFSSVCHRLWQYVLFIRNP